uniref:Uncharacterized protein LOC105043537 n=1 Tax=Elaeis guineensis var. tenera TaxID=51953 RepID=A0A6I9R4C8_ELAGV|nr:uncharacterized protein LOC105043537 [Elaeis guineensis]
MEVYVDDMIEKSAEEDQHIADLEEVFGELRKHQMKLNPNKCTFGVISDKFFDFLINQKAIEANFEKIRALLEINYPTAIREIQQLMGQLVISQVQSQFEAKNSTIARYLQNVKELSKGFEEFEVLQILRSENARADTLSHLTMSDFFRAESEGTYRIAE